MHVKVIGCQGHKCKTLKHHVRQVADRHGWQVTIEVIHDPDIIQAYGNLPTPALFIGGELICAGRSLSMQELEDLWVVNHD